MNEMSTTRVGSHSPVRRWQGSAASKLRRAILGGLKRLLCARDRLPIEASLLLMLYGLYELARGLVVSDVERADDHARDIVAIERWLHLFAEADVQHAANAVPGLTSALGTAYLTLHLSVTVAVLLWFHRRCPASFAFVCTTLLIASALSLVGFLVCPTAPPRLAAIGLSDTVSNGHIDLNRGLVRSLYNPYAAVPSMHIGYALIVAGSMICHARLLLVRMLAALYPLFVLLVVVATGNHFFLDAAAGAFVAAIAAVAAAPLTRPSAAIPLTALSPVSEPLRPYEEQAA
jgi:hypothetical protein